MGVKSLAEILKTNPKPIDMLMPFEKWIERQQENENNKIQR
ncbi:hypothetical protein BN3087_430022 [Sulfurovum sp. enrichment culture clone C5]|uniref:Uncharacterized protein n=1 Tax=Sulfurovum sp. enrichment culture clone C5 TaxID=497650 RepID=A0A0S4XN70_9BACT|nr:hypothetical protein BN3087_430022 [Sulfurovum sp. enrichment culture clone C5]